jgi:hypothetical protein
MSADLRGFVGIDELAGLVRDKSVFGVDSQAMNIMALGCTAASKFSGAELSD